MSLASGLMDLQYPDGLAGLLVFLCVVCVLRHVSAEMRAGPLVSGRLFSENSFLPKRNMAVTFGAQDRDLGSHVAFF